MRFLIDANMPRPTADVVRSLGHDVLDVRDIGMGAATDHQIAAYARSHDCCILTGDFDFADVRDYPPEQFAGIVVFALPDNADRPMILGFVEAFLKNEEVLRKMRGRLAIVEPGRVRLRPI